MSRQESESSASSESSESRWGIDFHKIKKDLDEFGPYCVVDRYGLGMISEFEEYVQDYLGATILKDLGEHYDVLPYDECDAPDVLVILAHLFKAICPTYLGDWDEDERPPESEESESEESERKDKDEKDKDRKDKDEKDKDIPGAQPPVLPQPPVQQKPANKKRAHEDNGEDRDEDRDEDNDKDNGEDNDKDDKDNGGARKRHKSAKNYYADVTKPSGTKIRAGPFQSAADMTEFLNKID